MPLDWDVVQTRYADGAQLPSVPGAATLSVTGADESYVYVKHRLWADRLSRSNLERAVQLLEAGQMVRASGEFIDQYRTFVADERPTTAATVLKDLGYVD
jgi:hypothetical protein